MTHEFRKVAAALAFVSLLPAASATVLTFDDLPESGAQFFAANYNGFQFGTNDAADTAWFYSDEVSPLFGPQSGSKFIATDASLYAVDGSYQATQPIYNATPFVFNGAYFSDALNPDQVTYQLYLGSALVYTSNPSFALTATPQYIASGFNGLVNSVVITAHQGYYALDNFTYNEAPAMAVPEPETYAMMLAGLVGLTTVVQRRRRPS